MNKQPWINAGQVILFVLMLLLSGVMTLVLLPVWVLACIADHYMRRLQNAHAETNVSIDLSIPNRSRQAMRWITKVYDAIVDLCALLNYAWEIVTAPRRRNK